MNYRLNLGSIIASATMMFILFLTSCSSNDNNAAIRAQLLDLIDDEALIVGAGDPAAFLTSAGAKVKNGEIVLPDNFKRMAKSGNKAVEALTELTSAKGVDYHNIVFSFSAEDYSIIFALTNASKFASWAKEKGMVQEEIGQFQVFTDDDNVAIVVDKNVAWLIADPESATAAAKMVDAKAASANQMPQWMADRLSKGDAAFIYDIDSAFEAIGKDLEQVGLDYNNFYNPECNYFAFDCTFDGPSLKFTGNSYSAEGQPVDMMPEGSYEPISAKALALVKDSQIALAFSVPNWWKQFAESMSKMNGSSSSNEYAKVIQKSIDVLKSISIGASLRDGVSIAELKPTDLIATAAIAYDKTGAEAVAKGLVDIAKKEGFEATLANGWNAWTEDSTFILAPIPQFPEFKIHFSGCGDLALVSTEASLSETELKPDRSLGNLTGYLSVDLKKDNPILKLVSCPFGIKIYATSNADSSECDITLTDCDGLFLETIIEFVSRF